MKFEKIDFNKLQRVDDRPKGKRGSNQYRRRSKTSVNGMCGAVAVIIVVTLTILHFTTVGISYGYSVTSQWVSQTFRFIAYAPQEIVSPLPKKAYANEDLKPSVASPSSQLVSQKDIIYQHKHGDIIYRIWTEESSRGKQPFLYCERRGMHNDFGFNVLNKQCFKTFNDEVNAVEYWIEQHEDMSLGQMLCFYNEGNSEHECTYTKNFMGI